MKPLASFALAVLLMVGNAVSVSGHGVILSSDIDEPTGVVTIRAAFDTGELMDDAQIAIFAPNDLINPWQTGVADAEGAFTFTPDYTIEGVWDVQVRKAGHGGLLRVTLDASMTPPENAAIVVDADSSAPVNTMQISPDSEIVITGDARFQVSGDIIINATGVNDANAAPAPDVLGNGFTPAQVIIMSISVIWGFVGTALYFAQRRRSSGAA